MDTCHSFSDFIATAICPFAFGRKAWLFSDASTRGARASASYYSLILKPLRPTTWNPQLILSLCWPAFRKQTRWRSWNCCCLGMRSCSRLQKRWLNSIEGKRFDLAALTDDASTNCHFTKWPRSNDSSIRWPWCTQGGATCSKCFTESFSYTCWSKKKTDAQSSKLERLIAILGQMDIGEDIAPITAWPEFARIKASNT